MGKLATLGAVGLALLVSCGLTEKNRAGGEVSAVGVGGASGGSDGEGGGVSGVGGAAGAAGAGGTGGGTTSNSGGVAGTSDPGPGGVSGTSRCDLPETTCSRSEASPAGHRLLSAELFNNTLTDLFGATPVADPETFPRLLDATGLEQVTELAHQVATELAADPDALLACASEESEGECIERFIVEQGLRIYRSPLSDSERAALFAVFDAAGGSSLAQGLEAVLVALLTSERFLYLSEVGQALLGVPGWLPSMPLEAPIPEVAALGGFELAARLSSWLWLSTPDDTLLELAASGELTRPDVLREQVRRLLDDPRAARALDGFHADWLGLTSLGFLIEDGAVNAELGAAMLEESLRVARDAYLDDNSFEALFEATHGYVNPRLAQIYGVASDPNADPEMLVRVELPTATRPGVFTRSGWLTATSWAEQVHPSQRGARLLSEQLCVDIPAPTADHGALGTPEDVPLSEYLRDLTTQPLCAACHAQFDPTGLAFDSYDAVGAYRGEASETAGSQQIPGGGWIDFDSAADLVRQIADRPEAYECLARRWLRSATTTEAALCSVQQVVRATCEDGQLVEMLAELATTEAFRLVRYDDSDEYAVPDCDRQASMNCEYLAERTDVGLEECLEQQGAPCDPENPEGVLPCLGVTVIRGCCSDEECQNSGIARFCGRGTAPHGVCVTSDAL